MPPECLIGLNNRHPRRCDWQAVYGPHRARFRFVIGSDAHQPHWLGQGLARRVAAVLGIGETLLFAA